MLPPFLADGRRASFTIALATLLAWAGPSQAASLSGRDVQIIAKALGFLSPRVPGGTVAIIYARDNAASKADAIAIAALFGDGIKSVGGLVTATVVEATSLRDGAGYIALIPAAGAESAVAAISRLHGVLTITSADALVRSGVCVMAVHSQPEVDIIVNRAAAQAAGINFSAAFSMLVHEI